jgi:hypothetical protein
MKKILSLIIIGAFLATSCYSAWDKNKPADNDIRKDFPAQARANWAAIELGTDVALQITNAKCAAAMGLADTKLAEIGTANKVNATAFKNLSGCPNGAGALPLANGGTGQTTGQAGLNALAGGVTANRVLRGNGTNVVLAQVGLTTDVTGTLPVGNGGTGATAAANAANGVVVPTGAVNTANGAVILNASGQLPAISGALLTNLPPPTGLGAWVDCTTATAHDNELAATDGFIQCVIHNNSGGNWYIKTDGSNPPTTIRAQMFVEGHAYDQILCSFVRKGDRWLVEANGDNGSSVIWWIPLGS